MSSLSIRALGNSARDVWKRFPLSFLFLCLLTLWALALVWDLVPDSAMSTHQSDVFSYYLGAGLLLSIMTEVWTEEIASKARRVTLKAVAETLWAANALVMALCFDDMGTEMAAGMASVCAAMAVGYLVLPFFREKDDMASWNFGIRSAWWAIWSLFVCAVMLGGLVLLLNAVRGLFGATIPDTVFSTLCVLLLIFLPLLIWLGKIPSQSGKFIREPFSSGFVTKSVRYLLVPLLTLYLAVLYAYTLKILVTWELPDGWVSWLVTALMGGYLVMALLFYAARAENLTRLDLWLIRNMPLLILPLVVVMSVGIVRRFMDYGVTANRLYILTLNLWFYYALLRMYFQKSRRISWVSVTLAVLMVLTSALPVNYHSIPRSIMAGHVRNVLSGQMGLGLPVSLDQYKQTLEMLPDAEARKLNAQCAYLAQDGQGEVLKGIISYDTYNPFDMIAYGLTPAGKESPRHFYWHPDASEMRLPEGFTRFTQADTAWMVGEDFITAKILGRAYTIERAQFDRLVGKVETLGAGDEAISQDMATLTCADGSLLLCTSLIFTSGSKEASISGYLFMK